MQHDGTDSTDSIGSLGRLARRLHWGLLVGLGGLTIVTGIGVLISLMSPENLQSVPTIALVSVLVMLCVPVPVLMLERNHRKNRVEQVQREQDQSVLFDTNTSVSTLSIARGDRDAVVHPSHIAHESGFETHRSVRAGSERKQAV